MVVDDSITARTVLERTIDGEEDLQVVASATSAENALEKLRTTDVDLILLDLEMPGRGGLHALPEILEKGQGAQVLVVSALTVEGAEATLEALAMGAADTLPKPTSGTFDVGYRARLLEKIRALGLVRRERCFVQAMPPARVRPANFASVPARKRVLGIGASTGGIHALGQFFRALPREVRMPILVAQHLPASFMPVFARQLETASGRPAVLAQDGMRMRPGHIYVAPGTGHLMVRKAGNDFLFTVENFPTPSGCTPSADPTFDSLAGCFGRHAICVVLSGMGRDGAEGATRIVDQGGTVLAQDQESSAVWGMPRAVWESGAASAVMPPEELAKAVAAQADMEAWK
jgi:two-component system chemotaxis response regulator CheB